MAQAEASQLAITICGCANRDQHRRDVAALLEYAETARLQGRREALEEAARVAEGCAIGDLASCEDRWDRGAIATARKAATAIRKLGEA